MCRFSCGREFSSPLGKYQEAWFLGHMVRHSSFCEKLSNCLLMWLYHFAFSPAVSESSCCFTSLAAFSVVSVLGFGHPNRCAVVHISFCQGLSFLNHDSKLNISCLFKSCMFYRLNQYVTTGKTTDTGDSQTWDLYLNSGTPMEELFNFCEPVSSFVKWKS